MRSRVLAAGVSAVALLMPVLGTAASATHQLDVQATVQGVCRFDDIGPALLDFGTVDPSTAVPAVASTTITYRCTNGTAATGVVDDSVGTYSMTGTSGDPLPYTVSYSGDTQTGSGMGPAGANARTLTVNGSIAVTDFQNAVADTYTDSLILTINF